MANTPTTAPVLAALPLPTNKVCLKCGKKFVKTRAAIQCNLCRLWIHRECTELDESDYKMLVDLSTKIGGSMWNCMSCTSLGSNLVKQVEAHGGAIKKLEEEVSRVNLNVENHAERLTRLESAPPSGGGGATLVDMYCEMEAIKVREDNIILHGTPSALSSITTAAARKNYDLTLIKMILAEIGISISEEDIRFFRRIAKRDDARPDRPLVMGLKDPNKKIEILKAAKFLAGSQYSYVSISHDLTRVQREAEERLKEDARLKNEANRLLPLHEQQRVEFKVVGRIGARQVRAIPLNALPRPIAQAGAPRIAQPTQATRIDQNTQLIERQSALAAAAAINPAGAAAADRRTMPAPILTPLSGNGGDPVTRKRSRTQSLGTRPRSKTMRGEEVEEAQRRAAAAAARVADRRPAAAVAAASGGTMEPPPAAERATAPQEHRDRFLSAMMSSIGESSMEVSDNANQGSMVSNANNPNVPNIVNNQ